MSTPKPKVTDAGLFALTISANDPGVGFALAQLNNIFKRAGEKYEMPKEQLNGDGPCLKCHKRTGFPYEGKVWCCNTRCEDHLAVFTFEEWEERRQQLIAASNAEY